MREIKISGLRLLLPLFLATILFSLVITAVSKLAAVGAAGPNLQPSGAVQITITGTVTSEATQLPVANVQVFAFSGEEYEAVLTNAQGSYSLTLASGIFYDIVFNPPAGSQLASQSVRRVEGSQTIDIALPPGFAISGTVYEDDSKTVGVENTAIFAFNEENYSGFGLPPSTTNGNYQISLEAGKWTLTFTPPHFSGLGPTQTMISLTSDISLDIILQPGFTVFGTIRTPGTDPVANVEMFAQDFSQENGYGFTPSDGGGQYTGTLPTGNFEILFIPPPFQGLGAAVITNVVGSPDQNRDVTLPVGFTVSGTVFIDNCTTPLPNAFVSATPHPPALAGQFGSWGKFSGEDGRYALPLPPGSYTITVAAPPSFMLPALAYAATITEDTTLNLYYPFCMLYLPLTSK